MHAQTLCQQLISKESDTEKGLNTNWGTAVSCQVPLGVMFLKLTVHLPFMYQIPLENRPVPH